MEGQSDENIESTVSQASYVPTGYENCSWEVVGDLKDTKTFEPMQVEAIKSAEFLADPMFADYGGLPQEKTPIRWHLPEELALQAAEEIKKEADPGLLTIHETEIAAMKAQAFSEGQEAGRAEANQANEVAQARIGESFKQTIQDLHAQMREHLDQLDVKAVALAVQISRKVVDTIVEVNPEYIIPIVKAALAQVGSASMASISVSPEDFEFIKVIGLREQLSGIEGAWEFVEDPSIRSGCVLSTTAGEINYNLDEAWERIKDKVLQAVK